MYEITFKGLDESIKAYMKFNKEFEERATALMRQHMETAVDKSRTEASTRGWVLADLIMLGMVEPLAVSGGCYAPYAAFPEFGTIHQAARPFWRPFVWQEFFLLQEDLRRLHAELFR